MTKAERTYNEVNQSDRGWTADAVEAMQIHAIEFAEWKDQFMMKEFAKGKSEMYELSYKKLYELFNNETV